MAASGDSTPLGDAHGAIRQLLRISVAAVILLVGGLGGWAAMAELAGAVIAPGVVVVASEMKKVQHPTGGIVGELNVRDGDHASTGKILLSLNETQTRAGLAIVVKAMNELTARQGRLQAEIEDAAEPGFSTDLLSHAHEPEISDLLHGERKLFALRKASREGQQAQLKERIAQLRAEALGITGQEVAKTREARLIASELAGLHELQGKNLVPTARVLELERAATRLEGERGQLAAQLAQVKGKVAEIELQILHIDQELRTEVGRELAELRAKMAELAERKIAAEDQLRRVHLRAPIDGTVHQLAVHTVGGVIAPGEVVMLLVPRLEALTVEARVPPQDIDRLHLGQETALRFSAFNQRTTPELIGEVARIAANVTEDPRTGLSYYTVRVTVPESEVARLGSDRLVPGMPVEAFIRTDRRTALSYLVKPLHDQVARAFRER